MANRGRVLGVAMAVTVAAAMWTSAAGAVVRTSGYVQMSDGVRLKYTLLRPAAEGRFPVMMQYEGYSAGDHPENDVPALVDKMLAKGVAVFGLSVRGTACSGGKFDLFDPQWGRDGAATVEWIARQPWSDGRVAMFGYSFAGIMQLFTAEERPAHLVAIAPGQVVSDLYRDVTYPGGLFNQFFAALFTVVQKYGDGTPDAVDQTSGGDSECGLNNVTRDDLEHLILLETRKRPFIDDDNWWGSRSPVGRLDRIDVPVLSSDSWQDEQTGVRGSYALLDHLRGDRTWMVFANGFHENYATLPRYQALLERFLTHYLLQERDGWVRTPHIQVWHEVSGPDYQPRSVTDLPVWPPPTLPMRLYLRSNGRLLPQAPAGEASETYAYPTPSPSIPLGPFVSSPQIPPPGSAQTSFDMPTVPGSSLNYTTPRLERDVEIMGPASADLWLSSTSSDTDLQVTVTEVRPDGQEQYVQRGWLRASHRMLDPQASTVTDPVATHRRRDARPLTPSVPTLVRVEVWPVGHTFRAGSSIRLTIDSPTGLTGFFGFAFTPDPAANTILHDAGHPSSLALPVLPGAAAQTPLPTCAGFEQAPCRPNHTAIPSGSVDLHADDDLGLPSTAGCVDRQRLALQLRSAGGERLVRARIRVSGRRPFVVRGAHRLSAPIAVRGLPPNSFLLRVVATTTSRHTLRAMRVYQTCL